MTVDNYYVLSLRVRFYSENQMEERRLIYHYEAKPEQFCKIWLSLKGLD